MSEGWNLGRQGGDTRGRAVGAIDLSSCVNRYGPVPAAKRAMAALDGGSLMHHPYGAADTFVEKYAIYAGEPPDRFVVQRGISGAVWALAASSLAPLVSVPLPAYTEYLRAFLASRPAALQQWYEIEILDRLMGAGRTVLISNPHNPSGTLLAPDVLESLASRNPLGRLVVDESYSEFVGNGAATLIGTPATNVAVLRSPSKFFGVAGVRVGAVWSRNEGLRRALAPRLGPWPVSEVEVAIAAAGLIEQRWMTSVRAQIRNDLAWLVDVVTDRGLVGKPAANFVLVERKDALQEAQELEKRGVCVRALGSAHGLPRPALRITAPREDERPQVVAALSAVMSSTTR